MIDDLWNSVHADLPRRVRGIEVNDPVLVLHGEDWSLVLMCPWEISGPDLRFTWESESIEDDAWELVGRDLLAVSSDHGLVDPVFHLSGEIVVEVRADTDLEPWTLRLPHAFLVGRRA